MNFKMAAEKEDFIRLRSTDESFQQRSDFVFARLERQEPTSESSEGVRRDRREQRTERSPRRRRNGNTQRLPARVPQHVLSPEKWTEYSLEIDGSEGFRGMNEHNLNTHAAHSFLANLRKRKAEKIEGPPERLRADSEAETNVSFRKPFVSKESDELSGKGVWKNGTFVMPEYMAGTSGRRSRAKRSGVRSQAAGCAKVSLGHLTEGCGDESTTSGSADFVKKQTRKRVFKKRKVDEDVEKKMDKEDGEIVDDEVDGKKMDDDGGEDGERMDRDGNEIDSDNDDG